MPWVAAVGAAVIGAGASLYGAYEGKQAADKQAKATRLAAQNSMNQFYQTRSDLAPYRAAGLNAENILAGKIAAGPGDFRKSPGYDFRLNQGINALDRGAASRGNLLNGGASKALTRYGQDYATNDYDNFLSRYYNSLVPLQNQASMGLGAAETTGQFGANAVNNQGNLLMAGANASGAGNAALAGGAYGIGGALNTGTDNMLAYKQYQDIQNYFNSQSKATNPNLVPTFENTLYQGPRTQ